MVVEVWGITTKLYCGVGGEPTRHFGAQPMRSFKARIYRLFVSAIFCFSVLLCFTFACSEGHSPFDPGRSPLSAGTMSHSQCHIHKTCLMEIKRETRPPPAGVNTTERIDISCRLSMMSMPSVGVASKFTQEAIHGMFAFEFCCVCYVMGCEVGKRSRALALL
jgi:hypothetical protein